MRPYTHTRVFEALHTPEMEDMSIRSLFAHAIMSPLLKWRHHQRFGVLQAYLYEGAAVESRIHIWHPELVVAELRNGSIHDHRFDFTSTVLHGTLEHIEYDLIADDEGEYEKYNVLHARLGTNEPTKLPGRFRAVSRPGVIRRDDMYSFPRGAFHDTKVSDLCVTVLHKFNQVETPAIIVAKAGEAPKFGVNLDPRSIESLVEKYVTMASKALMP